MTQKRAGRTVRRVPPPLTRSPGHRMLQCSEVLAEHADEPAILLWQTCRSVHLWGQPGPGLRLFAPGAAELRRGRLEASGVDEELLAPLGLLAALLENRRVVDVARLVEACREVARWGEGRGKLATALAFAQAAAVADAENASLAVAVGRYARMRAEYERAESWFEHAIVLARLTRDWQAYAEAYAGLGNLYVQKGSFPKARQYHQRCLRAAKRYALHEMEGAALHNLCCVALEIGNDVEAEEFASYALNAYPARNIGLVRLAYDVTYRWAVNEQFGRALTVAQELQPCFGQPDDRILAAGLLARVAGGAADEAAFEQASAEVWCMLGQPGAEGGAARGLLGLAHGAAHLGEWKRAARALRKSIEIATSRNEERVRSSAEALLASVEGEIIPLDVPNSSAGCLPDVLARRFADALREVRAVAFPV